MGCVSPTANSLIVDSLGSSIYFSKLAEHTPVPRMAAIQRRVKRATLREAGGVLTCPNGGGGLSQRRTQGLSYRLSTYSVGVKSGTNELSDMAVDAIGKATPGLDRSTTLIIIELIQ